MTKHIDWDDQAIAEDLLRRVERGDSMTDIAEHFGVVRQTIIKVRKRLGLRLRGKQWEQTTKASYEPLGCVFRPKILVENPEWDFSGDNLPV